MVSWILQGVSICGSDQVCSCYKTRVIAPRQPLTTRRAERDANRHIFDFDVKTGPVMITLSFLLFAALCLDAFKVAKEVYYQDEKMSWTEARLYCQKYHIDLVTSKVVEKGKLITFMKNNAVEQVWVGLLRDPEKDSVWKWIDVK